MSTQRVYLAGRNKNQSDLIDAIEHNTLVFAIGPAGVGKTYIACAMAAESFRNKTCDRILITRPMVETGDENVGALPGTLEEKMDPWLRPVFDSLRAYFSPEEIQYHMEMKNIEVCPVSMMRGRSLTKTFLIVDEAQNILPGQMMMLLTRLGNKSKAVVGGDLTQIDLPGTSIQRSGLYIAQQTLDHNLPQIKFVTLGNGDVVRSSIVKTVIAAYERRAQTEEDRLLQIEMAPFVSMNGNGA